MVLLLYRVLQHTIVTTMHESGCSGPFTTLPRIAFQGSPGSEVLSRCSFKSAAGGDLKFLELGSTIFSWPDWKLSENRVLEAFCSEKHGALVVGLVGFGGMCREITN